jgi:abortive infection bacteriophage resistance protein
MERLLKDAELKILREQGIISEDEIALWVGDLVVAENVCNRNRRVIQAKTVLAESKRRILKG